MQTIVLQSEFTRCKVPPGVGSVFPDKHGWITHPLEANLKKHRCYIEQVEDGWIEFQCKKKPSNWYAISPDEQEQDFAKFLAEGIKVLNRFCEHKHKILGQ